MGRNPHTTSFVPDSFTSLTLNYQQPNITFPSNWIIVNQQHNIFNSIVYYVCKATGPCTKKIQLYNTKGSIGLTYSTLMQIMDLA